MIVALKRGGGVKILPSPRAPQTLAPPLRGSYPQLAPLAEDLVSAPASQAFVERIFSVCGMLTTGRRNRMEKSLEMRVFLNLNAHLIN